MTHESGGEEKLYLCKAEKYYPCDGYMGESASVRYVPVMEFEKQEFYERTVIQDQGEQIEMQLEALKAADVLSEAVYSKSWEEIEYFNTEYRAARGK